MTRIAHVFLLVCLLFTSVAGQTAPSDYATQLQEYDRRVAAQNAQQNEEYARYLEADRASRTRTWVFLLVVVLMLVVYTIINHRIARHRIQGIMNTSRESHERSFKQGEQIIQLLASINSQLAALSKDSVLSESTKDSQKK